jgi:hypothetical protein
VHYPYYISHEATVSIKNGVPCFSVADEEDIRRERVRIYSFHMREHGVAYPNGEVWLRSWDKDITLSADECIPYEGDLNLKNNTIYLIGFSVYVEGQRTVDSHSYAATFCMTEDQNGETIVHQFDHRYSGTCSK